MVRLFLLNCEALPDLGHPDQRGAGWASRDRAGGGDISSARLRVTTVVPRSACRFERTR